VADVMIVDDDGELLQSLIRVLSPLLEPYRLCAASVIPKALDMARREQPSVAVIDLCIDEREGVESGFRLLQDLQQIDPTMRVLVLTGHGSVTHGIRAIQLGATSFLEKPVLPEHLAALVRDAAVQCELRRAHKALVDRGDSRLGAELSGTSAAVSRLREEIEFAASTGLPVLLLGETGTGKSLCARLIHETGARRGRKFVPYTPNFGGGDIVQSELFGHTKGAFTGATEARRGLVGEADGGTLFIDELDEVPAEMQVRLLDLIQEKRFRPIGSDRYQQVECRFIAATNRGLDEALVSGKIRRDLHHRIAHCVIALPSLRERREDMHALVMSCIRRTSERDGLQVYEISPGALDLCQHYVWPGNIRELQGVIERGVLLANHRGRRIVQEEDLGLTCSPQPAANAQSDRQLFHDRVEGFKRRVVREALDVCDGNLVRTARYLGVDRGTVRRLAGA